MSSLRVQPLFATQRKPTRFEGFRWFLCRFCVKDPDEVYFGIKTSLALFPVAALFGADVGNATLTAQLFEE